ncbi:hypothetical protein F3I16_20780, partial [Pseudomonas sp. L-22-4S-12]|uniref:hypothetical protein n=1 Tax=Pseudomonas sp. L-22-4S-12 TaxID=2610893 RepID=UPI00132C0328
HGLIFSRVEASTKPGAIQGSFGEAHDWYTMAEERGASQQSIDTELKGIFLRADKVSRENMRASLLATDPARYSWVNDKKYRNS